MKESKHIEYYNFVDKQKWNDKYLLMAASITFLVTCSYIFEKVKILTDRKFDISFFFSEIPLSSGETMAILASFGKVLFDILFISFEIDWFTQNNCSHSRKFRRNHIKINSFFFVSSALKSLNFSSAFVPQKVL